MGSSKSVHEAMAGTDVIVTLTGATGVTQFVAPVAMTVLSIQGSLGTAGTAAGPTTMVLNKNGTTTGLTASLAADSATKISSAVTGTVALAAGDKLDMTTTLATTAAGNTLTVWLQRATP